MNPYTVLGVEPDAEPATIKAAYRKYVKEHHPDKGGDAAMFREVQTAYDILSDPVKRRRYDETGEASADEFSMAEDTLRNLMNSVLDRVQVEQSLFDECEKEIRRNAANFEHEIKDVGDDLKRLVTIKARIRVTGSRDLVTELVETKLAQKMKRRADLGDAIKLAGDMLALLSGYGYEKPAAKTMLGRGQVVGNMFVGDY